VCAAFGPNTEARNRLAGGRVRIKLSLKIFQVKSKVQNIYFLNLVFWHTVPPISGCSFQVADLMSRDTSTAVCRSTDSNAPRSGIEVSRGTSFCDLDDSVTSSR